MKENKFSVERIEHMQDFFAELKLIDRGLYSGIFESGDPNTVLKATICPATYHMLNNDFLRIDDVHSPMIIKNYGLVGSYREKHTKMLDRKLVPLYLFEMEQLEKITEGDDYNLVRNFTLEFQRQVLALQDNIHFGSSEVTRILTGIVQTMPQLKELTTLPSYFEKLGSFIAAYGDGNAYYDIHLANLMKRKDGTIVFSDPVGTTAKGMIKQGTSMFGLGLKNPRQKQLLSNKYLKAISY